MTYSERERELEISKKVMSAISRRVTCVSSVALADVVLTMVDTEMWLTWVRHTQVQLTHR